MTSRAGHTIGSRRRDRLAALPSVGLLLACVTAWIVAGTAMRAAAGTPAPARADTVVSYWGPLPARADSTSAHFADRPRPLWENILLVPYRIGGVPFTVAHFLGDQALTGLDELGVFSMPPAKYVGLPLPLGFYLMPMAAIDEHDGTSVGLTLTRPELGGPDNLLFLTAENSTRHAVKVAAGSFIVLDRVTGLQLGVGVQERPVLEYYGLGPLSRRADESTYRRRAIWAGAELDRELGSDLAVELRMFFSSLRVAAPEYEVDQSIELVHAGRLPPGYPGRSDGWTTQLTLRHDTTGETGRPQSGGVHQLTVARFVSDRGPDSGYLAYRLNVERFLPLWYTKRALALRALGTRIIDDSAGGLPFSRLLNSYRPDELRGFESRRFFGRGLVAVSAEYRWPIWVSKGRNGPGVDAYLFTDAGQMFMDTRQIALDNVEVTWGFGLRLIGDEQNYLAHMEIGISREETRFALRFGQSFQHDTRGLLYGRDPTKTW